MFKLNHKIKHSSIFRSSPVQTLHRTTFGADVVVGGQRGQYIRQALSTDDRAFRTVAQPANRRDVYVKVPVPLSKLASLVRSVSYTYPSTFQKKYNNIRIPLREFPEPYKVVPVKITHFPKAPPVQPPAYSILTTKYLTHRPFRAVPGYAHYSRPQYSENKVRTRHYNINHINSVRKDKFGSLAYALRNNYSPAKIADIAMFLNSYKG